jgi:hypothetical protein
MDDVFRTASLIGLRDEATALVEQVCNTFR